MEEFLLWCNGIGRVLAALGCEFDPWHSGLGIWHCHSCSLGCNCALDLIPGLRTPYAVGRPRIKGKKKRERERRGERST